MVTQIKLSLFIIIVVLLEFFPSQSLSYIGPGMGGGFIAATLGIVVAILAAIFGLVYFPIKRFLKQKKKSKKFD